MSDQARERELGHRCGCLTRRARHATSTTSGKSDAELARRANGPHPREFDANGFPVPQRNTSFLERVARLLNPV